MTVRVLLGPLKEALMALASARGEESVGILVGRREGGEEIVVDYLYHASNIKHSSVEFEADPWHVVQAHVSAEKYGLDVVGVFHSHPSCPPAPSTMDVEGMKRWPLVWIIACPREVSAWRLASGRLERIPIDSGDSKDKHLKP